MTATMVTMKKIVSLAFTATILMLVAGWWRGDTPISQNGRDIGQGVAHNASNSRTVLGYADTTSLLFPPRSHWGEYSGGEVSVTSSIYRMPVHDPQPDTEFSPPVTIGPGSTHFLEDPRLVAERDGSLSMIWSYSIRDHVLYAHSTDRGSTWSDPVSIGGSPLWGGSEGNLWLVPDQEGRLHGYWYRLYGENYPSLEYRQRTADGIWLPSLEVPGSQVDREKIDALAVDKSGTAYLLAGHSGTTLNLFTTDGVDFGPEFSLPLAPNSAPNPIWLPQIAFSGKGAMMLLWGDARLGEYNLATAWQEPKNTSINPGGWNTYIFTDTGSIAQYHVDSVPLRDGGIGVAFEGRLDDAGAKDIFYREWNPTKYGLGHSGWATDTVRMNSTPAESEGQNMCVDSRGQRYIVWQAAWDNLRIVYSYSSDGVSWYTQQFVNSGGSYVREKHPTCAVTPPSASDPTGHLNIAWDDLSEQDGQAHLWFASRPLPDLYPPPPATPTAVPAGTPYNP